MSPERPVLRYFGGKWRLAPWIISHFPPHSIYVEPFGGGASVLMRKPRSYAEIYNDLDGEIVNVFREIQSNAAQMERIIRLTPFARDEFELSYAPQDGITSCERARRTIIRSFMGFGSNGHNSDERTGFRANSNRSGMSPARDWANWPDEIIRFCERLRGVVIENRDYWAIIKQQDSPETLHYLDPPYPHDTRTVKTGYRHEMTNQEHEILCSRISGLRGMVVLSGYDNPIYECLKWTQVRRESLADGAKARVEVLWLSPSAIAAHVHPSFL